MALLDAVRPRRQGARRTRTGSRAASSSASRSSGRWRCSPTCCCSTRSRPRSTRSSSPRCSTSIRELAAGGMTMLIATHEMGFARDIANRVCFLDAGPDPRAGAARADLLRAARGADAPVPQPDHRGRAALGPRAGSLAPAARAGSLCAGRSRSPRRPLAWRALRRAGWAVDRVATKRAVARAVAAGSTARRASRRSRVRSRAGRRRTDRWAISARDRTCRTSCAEGNGRSSGPAPWPRHRPGVDPRRNAADLTATLRPRRQRPLSGPRQASTKNANSRSNAFGVDSVRSGWHWTPIRNGPGRAPRTPRRGPRPGSATRPPATNPGARSDARTAWWW